VLAAEDEAVKADVVFVVPPKTEPLPTPNGLSLREAPAPKVNAGRALVAVVAAVAEEEGEVDTASPNENAGLLAVLEVVAVPNEKAAIAGDFDKEESLDTLNCFVSCPPNNDAEEADTADDVNVEDVTPELD